MDSIRFVFDGTIITSDHTPVQVLINISYIQIHIDRWNHEFAAKFYQYLIIVLGYSNCSWKWKKMTVLKFSSSKLAECD
jgi:hypothetical protein